MTLVSSHRTCLFCASFLRRSFSSLGLRMICQYAVGARTRSCSVSFGNYLVINSDLPLDRIVKTAWDIFVIAIVLVPFGQLKKLVLVWFWLCLSVGGWTFAGNATYCPVRHSVVGGGRRL